jgi:hypothetical protein
MFLSLCCCGDLLPACFKCGTKRGRFDWSKLSIVHSGFTGFAYATEETVSCSGTNTTGSGDYTYDATQVFMDPGDIPTNCELWQRPASAVANGFGGAGNSGSGSIYPCEWLWNDVRSWPSVTHRVAVDNFPYYQEHSEYSIGSLITPINATDSADPWNRVFPTITDSRCATKVIPTQGLGAVRWECGYVNSYISLSLRVYNAAVYGMGTTDQAIWYALVQATFSYYGKTNRDWNGLENDGYDAVYPFFNATTSSGAAVASPAIPQSCFPFDGTWSSFGGGFASYGRLVDCANDFNGDAISIPRLTTGALGLDASRATDYGITCPSDIEINLQYI